MGGPPGPASSSPGTILSLQPSYFLKLNCIPEAAILDFLAPRNLWCESRQRNLLGCIWKEGRKLRLG